MVTSKLAAKLQANPSPHYPPLCLLPKAPVRALPRPHRRRLFPLPRAGRRGAGATCYEPKHDGREASRRLERYRGVHLWLRTKPAILETSISEKTPEQYERNGTRLHAARVTGQPVDLTKHEISSSTFFMPIGRRYVGSLRLWR